MQCRLDKFQLGIALQQLLDAETWKPHRDFQIISDVLHVNDPTLAECPMDNACARHEPVIRRTCFPAQFLQKTVNAFHRIIGLALETAPRLGGEGFSNEGSRGSAEF